MSNTEKKADNNNEVQFSAAVEECINEIIKKEGFIEHTINIKSISTNGGNYLGDLYEIDIKGNTLKGTKELNLFIKKIRILENRTVLSESVAHAREIKVYEEILPVFAEMEKEVNIPEEERFKHAKCYASTNEVLIFENLAKKGYKTLDRTDVMSLEYAKRAVLQLAKFHALSFALKQRRPDFYMAKIQGVKHPMNFNDSWDKFIGGIIHLVTTYLEDEPKRKIQEATPKIMESFEKYLKYSEMALCHGDYRINNILFKEQDGKITDMVPIDFQIMHQGHPLNDFMYIIFQSSDKKFRNEHLQSMKEYYYESLKNYLRYFKIDVEHVYAKSSFDADYQERLFYGLTLTISMFPILFRNDNVEEDSKLTSIATLAISMHEAARDRIRDIVDDYIEWGLL